MVLLTGYGVGLRATLRAALPGIAAAAAPAAPAAQTRCGWYAMPTPGNLWLTDRDATWVITSQGQALGLMRQVWIRCRPSIAPVRRDQRAGHRPWLWLRLSGGGHRPSKQAHHARAFGPDPGFEPVPARPVLAAADGRLSGVPTLKIMRLCRCFIAAWVSQAAAAGEPLGFDLNISLSPKAAAVLKKTNEGITVPASCFGDPTPAAAKHADEIG